MLSELEGIASEMIKEFLEKENALMFNDTAGGQMSFYPEFIMVGIKLYKRDLILVATSKNGKTRHFEIGDSALVPITDLQFIIEKIEQDGNKNDN